jgi:hypothetical protein
MKKKRVDIDAIIHDVELQKASLDLWMKCGLLQSKHYIERFTI